MFEHSVKVPRLYKTAAKILQESKEKRISVKQLVYQCKHCNIKAIYALVVETLKHFSEINTLIEKSELLVKEDRFDPWLARILITEIIWAGKDLSNNNSKPIKTILSYRDVLERHKLSHDSKSESKIIPKVRKPRFVRINTLAVTLEEAVNGFQDEGWRLTRFADGSYGEYVSKAASLEPDEFMIDLHIKELLLFPSNMQFYNHKAYRCGSIILQDKASCLPGHLLNPTPGSSVLDMCAAPGMKTTHLAALLNNQGIVYAVERDHKRFNTLNEMVQNVGATCVVTINKDVLKVTAEDCPDVEYILVDPSCSGSGMTERVAVDNEDEMDPRRLERLSGFQIVILKHALTHFPCAKRVVYSTCSVYSQENEFVVNEVLKTNTDFKLVSAKNLLNGSWENSVDENWDFIRDNCLCMQPEKDLTNGFFIAVFERDEAKSNLGDDERTTCKTSKETLAEDFSIEDHFQHVEKKSKKKKRKDTRDDVIENTQENEIMTRKKEKIKEDDNCFGQSEQNNDGDIVVSKKKKKNKEQKMETNTEDDRQAKNKKNKRKSSDTQTTEKDMDTSAASKDKDRKKRKETDQETEVISKKEKKKEKNEEVIIYFESTSVNHQSKKHRKKENFHKYEIIDTDADINFISNKPKKHKKKHKAVKDAETNEIDIDQDLENVCEPKKKISKQ